MDVLISTGIPTLFKTHNKSPPEILPEIELFLNKSAISLIIELIWLGYLFSAKVKTSIPLSYNLDITKWIRFNIRN